MSDGKIVYDIEAGKVDLSKGDSSIKQAASKWDAIFTGVGQAIGHKLADGVSGAVNAAWSLGTAFEDGMAKVSTLADENAMSMDALGDDILGVSKKYGLAADGMTEAAYNALSSNSALAGDQAGLMSALDKSARLSKAGFTDVDTALSASLKTLNAYGKDISEIDSVQKVLMQTQNYGITTVGELGSVLSNVTPTAAAMNVSFEQVGAALATMTAQGTPAAQSATQLNSLFAELGKKGTQAQKGFNKATKGTKYAGKSFQQLMAQGVPLNEVLGLMDKSARKNGLTLLDMFSSVEAGKAALAMTGKNAETFTENLSHMSEEADVVGIAYEKVSNTVSEKLNKVKETLNSFWIGFYMMAQPYISALLDYISGFLDWLSTDGVGGIKVFIDGVVSWFQSHWTQIEPVLSATKDFLALLASWLASVALPAILSFVNGAVTWFREHWTTIQGYLEIVRSVLQAVVEWFTQTALPAIKAFVDGVVGWFKDHWSTIQGYVDIAKNAVSTVVSWFTNKALPAIKTFCSNVATWFSDQWNKIGPIVKTVKSKVSDIVTWFNATAKPAIQAFVQTIKDWFDTNFEKIRGIWEGLQNVVNGVVGFFTNTILPDIKAFVDGVVGWFRDKFQGSDGPGNIITSLLDTLLSFVNWLVNTALPFVGDFVQGAYNFFKDVFSAIGPVVSGIADGIGSFVDGFTGWLSKAGEFCRGIKDKFDTFFAPVKSLIDGIAGALSSVFGWLTDLDGKSANVSVNYKSNTPKVVDKTSSGTASKTDVASSKGVRATKLAVGDNFIPYDNYPALLHRGEAVLNRAQASAWRESMNRQSVRTGPLSGASGGTAIDYDKLAHAMSGLTVVMDGKAVGKLVEPTVSDAQARKVESMQRSGYNGRV